MLIQIHTDHNIDSGDELTRHVEDEVESAFSHHASRLTRADVHLSDESAGRKTGADMKCMIEVRPASHEPVVVTAHAPTVDEALGDAVDKMQHLLGSLFGRLDERHPGAPSAPRS